MEFSKKIKDLTNTEILNLLDELDEKIDIEGRILSTYRLQRNEAIHVLRKRLREAEQC